MKPKKTNNIGAEAGQMIALAIPGDVESRFVIRFSTSEDLVLAMRAGDEMDSVSPEEYRRIVSSLLFDKSRGSLFVPFHSDDAFVRSLFREKIAQITTVS